MKLWDILNPLTAAFRMSRAHESDAGEERDVEV